MLHVVQIPVLQDNYAYLLVDAKSAQAVSIDTPDPTAILQYCQEHALNLTAIWNTHHHWDHAGGNEELVKKTGCKVFCGQGDVQRIPGDPVGLQQGDQLEFAGASFSVLAVPGHTSGHIAYHGNGLLFCGDTIFACGCGRLFEGTPEQMFVSLQKLCALPKDTKIYCAHEYTLSNIAFALRVEPNNNDLLAFYEQAKALRANKESTVPTSLGDELKYNPFLRATSVSEFAQLRKQKDEF
ncbi:MAG: hydroxyacylglutathione hydrolase [Deltaproteobacteria bacterium]|nr:hydroxyacylglutathione hydrolase [Deltaproteobacteria bacterium]